MINQLSENDIRLVAGLEAHPLSDDIFGPMGDEEFEELKEDLGQRGLNHPLELDLEGRVICGSQRLRAIKELGWHSVKVVVIQLDDETAVVKHLILDNLLRRHLTPGMIYKAGKALEQVQTNGTAPTLSAVAKDLKGVTSYTNYWRIRKIMDSGDEELIASVESGETKVFAAHKQLKDLKTRSKGKIDSRQQDVMMFIRYKKRLERFKVFLRQNPVEEFGTYAKDVRRTLRETISTAEDLMKE